MQLRLIMYPLQRALSAGLRKRRAKARQESVEWEEGGEFVSVWEAEQGRVAEHDPGIGLPAIGNRSDVALHFHAPLRLQHESKPLRVHRPSPRTLVTTLIRRVSLMFELHADRRGAVADPQALAVLAERLQDERDLRWLDGTRYYSRQRQEISLGGVVDT